MQAAWKVQNCMDLKPIKDRCEIPVYPMLISYPGIFAGIRQKEMVDDPKMWMKALKKTYDHFGYPDLCINLPLSEIIFAEGLEARRPGYELSDDAQFQFIEKPRMDHDDYRQIIAKGWAGWFSRYVGSIQSPPIRNNLGVTIRWVKLGLILNRQAKFLRGLGVEPISGMAIQPLFDQISLIRSFEDFIVDLYTEPGLIHTLLKKETPGLIKSTLANAKRTTVKRIHVYPMRSDANSISPKMFDEFSFPYLRQVIEGFHQTGYRSVVHADGNWVPMLDRFLKLPKASIHFEFDGLTDMFKAYEIIGGWHSMRGDVPAAMLAFGTADEVSEHCEKLVAGLGVKGGFILGSGCEVPMNCKAENLMAMMKAVKG